MIGCSFGKHIELEELRDDNTRSYTQAAVMQLRTAEIDVRRRTRPDRDVPLLGVPAANGKRVWGPSTLSSRPSDLHRGCEHAICPHWRQRRPDHVSFLSDVRQHSVFRARTTAGFHHRAGGCFCTPAFPATHRVYLRKEEAPLGGDAGSRDRSRRVVVVRSGLFARAPLAAYSPSSYSLEDLRRASLSHTRLNP